MSKGNDIELGDALNGLIRASKRGCVIIDGKITSIDEVKYTCSVLIGKSTFNNVPLRVLINSQSSICEIPEINSICLMTFRDGNIQCPQIFSIDKCKKILLTCDDIELKGTVIKLNGLNIAEMVKTINGTPINEPGNNSPSAFQTALKTALNA